MLKRAVIANVWDLTLMARKVPNFAQHLIKFGLKDALVAIDRAADIIARFEVWRLSAIRKPASGHYSAASDRSGLAGDRPIRRAHSAYQARSMPSS